MDEVNAQSPNLYLYSFRYEEDGTNKKFFVSSGSVTINEDSSVQILAEEAHKLEDIDAASAR